MNKQAEEVIQAICDHNNATLSLQNDVACLPVHWVPGECKFRAVNKCPDCGITLEEFYVDPTPPVEPVAIGSFYGSPDDAIRYLSDQLTDAVHTTQRLEVKMRDLEYKVETLNRYRY